MEAFVEGDDLVAAGVAAPEARDLDHVFVGLGAGVGEEGFVAAGEFGEALGEEHHVGVVVEVGAVGQHFGLADDGGGDVRVAVAAGQGGDAGGEVDVLHAVNVGDLAAVALEERHCGGIGVHEVLLVQVGNVVGLVTHRL